MLAHEYVFRDIKLPPPKKLVWNVFIEHNNEIKVYNIFEHGGFLNSLIKAKKQLKADLKTKKEEKAIEDFKEKVWGLLSYYFWSKCEWEINLTSWINPDRCSPLKIDVYDQVNINFSQFIDYLWANKDELMQYKLKR